MRRILQQITYLAILVLVAAWSETPEDRIGTGLQPQLSWDSRGIIRIVYGHADSIFCATSRNTGTSFSQPVFVGKISGMHLGMTRGPQIASSANYSIITAIDKTGNIHFFRLAHATGKWEYKGKVNDIPGSAPEGLMSVAADRNDNFYAAWLDIRQGKTNNICFSSLPGKTGNWKKNKLIYTSPDGHVCECCKPGIDVSGSKVAIMYRNWLEGARDLYLMTSDNKGLSFTGAQKLGFGTWKLNGCPMDGGSVHINETGALQTTWQREGVVYYCQPNKSEVKVLKGRACSIAASKASFEKPVIALQDGDSVKIVSIHNQSEIAVGKGRFLKSLILDNEQIFCVWEQDENIRYKNISTPSAKEAFVK